MATPNELLKFEKHVVVIDCVVFGFFDCQVKTLLVRGKADATWSVMSSLVTKETVEETAQRALCRLPGIVASHLEQLKVYTDFDRYGEHSVMAVTMCAIVRVDDLQLSELPFGYQWFAFDELPLINDRFLSMFLHAKKKLREKASDFFTMARLLPSKFTIIQLQRIYESISEMRLDKGNFAKRFLSANILRRLDEKNVGTSKKGSYYYEFDDEYSLTREKSKHYN